MSAAAAAMPVKAGGPRGADLLAGLSVAGVLLPEAVAYAAIAGVPPVHAFIAALCGLLVYPLIGSSRFAIVAPTSSAAAVFASAVATGGVDLGFALVLLTAALFLLAAALKAEFLGAFISRPVLRGFAWGLAVTIVLKQVPHVMGVHAESSHTLALAWELLQRLPRAHHPSLWLGVAALALWLVLRHVVGRRVKLPPSLVVLALGTAWAAWATSGGGTHGVALVGHIDWPGLQLHLPSLDMAEWLHAAQIAPALLLILFAESWGSVRSLALQTGDSVNTRRELAALGAANLASGLLQGLPVGAGFSAATANQSSGAQSRLAGVAAAAALALLLWWGRGALALLPQPVLAAVVIGILSHNLWPKSVIESLRLGGDAWLAVAAAASVLVFGVLFGMLVAVGLSLVLAIRRFSQPLVVEIARLPGTHDFLDRERHAGLEPPAPGVLLMRPEEPLFFANTEAVLRRVREQAASQQARVVVLSLEMTDDLDSTTVEAIGEFTAALTRQGAQLLLARVKDRVRLDLARAGLDQLSPDTADVPPPARLFWSVDDAYAEALTLVAAPMPGAAS